LITAWRLVAEARADTAFDGEGSYKYGNRWNHEGTRVVYLAHTTSLAALEILVHAKKYQALPMYSAFSVTFDERLLSDVPSLPNDWQQSPAPESTKTLGSRWAAGKRSVVLRVPSVIVPWEYNYVLNILHPDFRRVKIGKSLSFTFDRRLEG
jgi:RES domain-containing protein